MANQTPHGLPYPLPTDPLSAGAADIRALAEALEAMLAGTLNANAIQLAASLIAAGVIQSPYVTVPSGTPGGFLDLGQGGTVPGPPGQAGVRLYGAYDGGANSLYVVFSSGARVKLAGPN